MLYRDLPSLGSEIVERYVMVGGTISGVDMVHVKSRVRGKVRKGVSGGVRVRIRARLNEGLGVQ